MIGLLVKNGTDYVARHVFAGDDVKNQSLVDDFIAKNPALAVEVHRDSDNDWITAFLNVALKKVQTQDQIDWQAAKATGAQAAILFIAKKLGLE